MLAKTNVLVFYFVFRYRSVLSPQETNFFYPSSLLQPLPSLCHHLGTQICVIMQSSQLSSLQTDTRINEDNEITRAEGLGVLVGLDMDQL